MKTCRVCKLDLPFSAFRRTSSGRGIGGVQATCKACARLTRIETYRLDPERDKARSRRRALHLKMSALLYYSDSMPPECACCGESHIEFLEIDHVNGGGNIHRRESRITVIYEWLWANDYPEGFRVLCSNCNSSLGRFGYCPHDRERTRPETIEGDQDHGA